MFGSNDDRSDLSVSWKAHWNNRYNRSNARTETQTTVKGLTSFLGIVRVFFSLIGFPDFEVTEDNGEQEELRRDDKDEDYNLDTENVRGEEKKTEESMRKKREGEREREGREQEEESEELLLP